MLHFKDYISHDRCRDFDSHCYVHCHKERKNCGHKDKGHPKTRGYPWNDDRSRRLVPFGELTNRNLAGERKPRQKPDDWEGSDRNIRYWIPERVQGRNLNTRTLPAWRRRLFRDGQDWT